MLLYNNPGSGNCYKVRLLMAHRGLPYTCHDLDVIDRSDRPALMGHHNPALRVPTLIDDEGRALPESNAILWYLAQGTSWIPTDPFDQAQVLRWMFWEQYEHEPAIAVLRYMRVFSGEAADQPERVRTLDAASHRVLGVMEGHLQNHTFFVAEAPSIADICLYAYTHVAHEAASTCRRTRLYASGWRGWRASRGT